MTVLLMFMVISPVKTYAKSYNVSGTDLTITVDDTVWYVFTRDNLANNPELDELGVDYNYLNDYFHSNFIYMDAVVIYENGATTEFFIRKTDEDVGVVNLANCKGELIGEIGDSLADKFGADGYSILNTDYKFIKLNYFDPNLEYYAVEYYTIINKHPYTFTFQSPVEFTEWEYEEFDTIIKSIVFDIDTSLKEDSFMDTLVAKALTGALSGAVIGGVGAAIGKLKKKMQKNTEEDINNITEPK